jgi:hypothetical protein
MTLTEQLSFGDPIFKQVEEFRSVRRISELSELISSSNPPDEWIIELQSIANPKDKFKSIKLELLEAVAKRIFGYYKLSDVSQPIIVQDKQGSIAVTINVEIEVRWFDGTIRKYPGIATEVVSNMRLLPLATPKASSMAVKNALKQLGKLFGKHLNNEADDVELPIVESQPTIEDQTNAVTQGIVMANTISDLKSWRNLAYSKMGTKEQQDLYETKLRQLNK